MGCASWSLCTFFCIFLSHHSQYLNKIFSQIWKGSSVSSLGSLRYTISPFSRYLISMFYKTLPCFTGCLGLYSMQRWTPRASRSHSQFLGQILNISLFDVLIYDFLGLGVLLFCFFRGRTFYLCPPDMLWGGPVTAVSVLPAYLRSMGFSLCSQFNVSITNTKQILRPCLRAVSLRSLLFCIFHCSDCFTLSTCKFLEDW